MKEKLGSTITEKILAKASGNVTVSPGDDIAAKPNAFVFIDGGAGWCEYFEKLGISVWDPDRVVVTFDHFPQRDWGGGMGKTHRIIRQFCKKHGIKNLYDVGRHGVSHQVPAEEGFVLPGTFVYSADTMAPTLGGLGCVAFPSAADIDTVAALGEVWVRVPESIKFRLSGALGKGVVGRDIGFKIMGDLGSIGARSRVMEFDGRGAESLSIDSKMSLCNTAGVANAPTAIVNPDKKIIDYVTPKARWPFEAVRSDRDAKYADVYDYDLKKIDPQVAAPSAPTNIKHISEVEGVEIDAANIGSCASARIEDLTLAANILRGRKIHDGVRLIITPVSMNVSLAALRLGLTAIFQEAGAIVTEAGCGSCYDGNSFPCHLGDGEVCVTTSTMNTPGRMGSQSAEIYIANAGVVAASVIEGKIADPRKYLR